MCVYMYVCMYVCTLPLSSCTYSGFLLMHYMHSLVTCAMNIRIIREHPTLVELICAKTDSSPGIPLPSSILLCSFVNIAVLSQFALTRSILHFHLNIVLPSHCTLLLISSTLPSLANVVIPLLRRLWRSDRTPAAWTGGHWAC